MELSIYELLTFQFWIFVLLFCAYIQKILIHQHPRL